MVCPHIKLQKWLKYVQSSKSQMHIPGAFWQLDFLMLLKCSYSSENSWVILICLIEHTEGWIDFIAFNLYVEILTEMVCCLVIFMKMLQHDKT